MQHAALRSPRPLDSSARMARASWGHTAQPAPAHRAASQGRLAVLKVLFTEDTELGTKIDERDSCGSTPLLVAAEAGQDECAIFLAKCGANVHAVDNEKHGVPERLRGVLKSI